jgi:hypothetical protein
MAAVTAVRTMLLMVMKGKSPGSVELFRRLAPHVDTWMTTRVRCDAALARNGRLAQASKPQQE